MTSNLMMQLVDSEIKISELTGEVLARDSEILRLETEIVNLKSQLSFKTLSKTSRQVQTDPNLNSFESKSHSSKDSHIKDSLFIDSSTFHSSKQKYIQRITDLEAKLIESDRRNFHLDSIIRGLHKTIETLQNEPLLSESLSPEKTLNSTQSRLLHNSRQSSQVLLKKVNSVSTYFKKQRKQASSFFDC